MNVLEKKVRPCVKSGDKIGRWLVLDDTRQTTRGEMKYLCRCECGTERYVLERSLRYGGSLSCGCLRKEIALSAISLDLTGQSFGDLKVLHRSTASHTNGGIWWVCACACGQTCEYPGTLLATGRRTHCGCKTDRCPSRIDITGRKFGRLTPLHKTKGRTKGGSIIWRCLCECCNEVDVPYNSLMYGNQQSCGCKAQEHSDILRTFQTTVDGTCINIIQSKTIPRNNTSGVRGVAFSGGKYYANISFQKKTYRLGTYRRLEDAAAARRRAEDELFGSTVDYYAKWEKRAAADPEWAAQNPVRISVYKEDGLLRVRFEPEM